jgi:hypothetical protein
VLETWLPAKNDITICFFDMKHSWTKYAFWDVNNTKWRKWCKFVSLSLFNNTYGLPVLTIDTKYTDQVFYVRLFDLQTICANLGLEPWLSPNTYIRECLLDMRQKKNKKAFWDVSNKKWTKWSIFFHISNFITLKDYLC